MHFAVSSSLRTRLGKPGAEAAEALSEGGAAANASTVGCDRFETGEHSRNHGRTAMSLSRQSNVRRGGGMPARAMAVAAPADMSAADGPPGSTDRAPAGGPGRGGCGGAFVLLVGAAADWPGRGGIAGVLPCPGRCGSGTGAAPGDSAAGTSDLRLGAGAPGGRPLANAAAIAAAAWPNAWLLGRGAVGGGPDDAGDSATVGDVGMVTVGVRGGWR